MTALRLQSGGDITSVWVPFRLQNEDILLVNESHLSSPKDEINVPIALSAFRDNLSSPR